MIELNDDGLSISFPEIHNEACLNIDFQRTLRIPDDDKVHFLPPGLGRYPLRHVDDFADKVPAPWREHGGVMLPMFQSEALWLNFSSPHDYPVLLKISAGKVNAVTGEDWTDRMNMYSHAQVEVLQNEGIDGFVLKKDSPSCGMERVRLYDDNGMPSRDGRGLFAGVLLDRFPSLPVEEEGRLNDHSLRECFVTRIFAYQRWREFLRQDPTPAKLIQFHTSHKYLLLAHSPALYYRLGPQVAEAGSGDFQARLASYETDFMKALADKLERK